MVAKIQSGDPELRNELIRRYHPYILKIASRFFRRYIDPQHDDEFSVALAAFDEAITRYSPDGGRLFLGFAETVITRRLIDYTRQESKHAASVPYSAFDRPTEAGDHPANHAEIVQAMAAYQFEVSAEDRRLEIVAFTEELAAYGITFADLVELSPRHQDSREMLLRMGGTIARSVTMHAILREKKQLPVKELCQSEPVSRKTVERHRKYLIAVALIASGAYPYLKQYIGLAFAGEEEQP